MAIVRKSVSVRVVRDLDEVDFVVDGEDVYMGRSPHFAKFFLADVKEALARAEQRAKERSLPPEAPK